MSLTSALSIAQTALLNTSRQTTVVSRNIAEANNPDYARRSAELVSTGSGARIVGIQRAASDALFRQNLSALSMWTAQDTLFSSMSSLSISVNGPDNGMSPATLLGEFQQALQTYAAAPSSGTVAETAVEAARNLVRSLNDGANAIQSFRADMDRQIDRAVTELNGLLADFEKFNKEVVSGSQFGRDVNDALDRRDALLKKISEIVPVSVVQRSNSDMVLVSGSGAILFETVPREVTFQPVTKHAAGVPGNVIHIDGTPVSAGVGGNTTASGKLAAMVQLREDVAGGMQAQLDEIARGLIAAFAETDPDGVDPPAAGLFTWPGAPAIPPDGTLVDGLAGAISINAAFDSRVGGNPHLLRDGGANGPQYVANQSGGTGFTGLLMTFQNRLETPIAFDPAARIQGTLGLAGYSSESVSWLQAMRQDASRASESKSALVMRTEAALSNATGVNVEMELTLLLDLEHTYQASARLLAAIDGMLSALMNAVR